MVKYILLTSLITLAITSCRNITFRNVLDKKTIEEASLQKSGISEITHREDDPSFSYKQDTLFYEDRKYDGFVIRLFPGGDTAVFMGYRKGVQEGISKKWYSPNVIQETRYYHSGKKVGTHTGYWENGNPKFEYHFEEGEHEGELKEWYQNGQSYRIFHYRKGYEEGSQKMWWENGVIRANYVVKNGRRFGLIGLKLCMNPGN